MSQECYESQDFRCVFCRQPFSPPSSLPYLLTCTHSVCSNCIARASAQHQTSLICPEDLETNSLCKLRSNGSARRALQRLVNQHKKFNQNNQLIRIQSLSKHFEAMLQGRSRERADFRQLIDKVIEGEVARLQKVQRAVVEELEGPMRMVGEWKQMVRQYLSMLKSRDRSRKGEDIVSELNFYIEEGRRIKAQLNHHQALQFDKISNIVASNPQICLQSQFSLKNFMQKPQGKGKTIIKNKKIQLHALIQHADPQINLPQSIINTAKNKYEQPIIKQLRQKQNNQPEKDISRPTYTKKLQSQLGFSTATTKNPPLVQTNNKLTQIITHRIQSPHSHPYLPSHHSEGHSLNEHKNQHCDRKLFLYSPDQNPSPERPQQESDQILLTEKQQKGEWALANLNFLQQWQISHSSQDESVSIRKRQPFNWQRQKNAYIRKMQAVKVEQARSESACESGCLEVINYPLCDVDMYLYLHSWDWPHLQTIKFVRTGFTDAQLNELLNFMLNGKVNTLVLSGNSLTELSLDAILNFTKLNAVLRNVYLSKNNINSLKGHTRQKVGMLRGQGINLYI